MGKRKDYMPTDKFELDDWGNHFAKTLAKNVNHYGINQEEIKSVSDIQGSIVISVDTIGPDEMADADHGDYSFPAAFDHRCAFRFGGDSCGYAPGGRSGSGCAHGAGCVA